MIPEITVYPDSEEQYQWICDTIAKGMDAFQVNAKEAVVRAFELLEQEADLQTEWQKKVHATIKCS